MSRLHIISFCVIVFSFVNWSTGAHIQNGMPLKCGHNEELDKCPMSCGSDFCPETNLPPQPCVRNATEGCDSAVCKCIFNHRRQFRNGPCIPTTSCPPFICNKPNEEYVACPPYCPQDTCRQATEDGSCPYSGFYLTAYCTPACRCIKSFWRNEYGICIPYQKCVEHGLQEYMASDNI